MFDQTPPTGEQPNVFYKLMAFLKSFIDQSIQDSLNQAGILKLDPDYPNSDGGLGTIWYLGGWSVY